MPLPSRPLLPIAVLLLALLPPSVCPAQEPDPGALYDVVIYGGTSSGVIAAMQTVRLGGKPLLIEPSRHLGGLSSGGLGATDIGNKAAIGGLARAFYHQIWKHYQDDSAWRQESRDAFAGRGHDPGETTAWTFEPHVAERIFQDIVREHAIPVLFGERLDLAAPAQREGNRLSSLSLESGRVVRGRMFIDATYEGDLIAKAGVRYTIGREAASHYGESLNGVQTERAVAHQFIRPVDPWVVPGDPASGLLFGIQSGGPGTEKAGDHRVQAYCFRLCATDVPENRRPWPRPADYDESRYELLLRNFEAGDHREPWNPVLMPNRKTDSNNNFAVSTDYIGMNYAYPDADYAGRERIVASHLKWTQGLMWTLANHPRVPETVRRHFRTWGLAKDEFTGSDNWPHQLYVREARRMVSDYVMTQANCLREIVVEDSVGMGAYNMDSHNLQRYVNSAGEVRNEGDIQVKSYPYPISYRSIVPARGECGNVFAPTCLSASHIAFGSIRMEPVFMVLGQSAASAAMQAIAAGVEVQNLDYAMLRLRLLEDGQVLDLDVAIPPAPVDPARLEGLAVDDSEAGLAGFTTLSTSVAPYVGTGYRHDGNADKGKQSARFSFPIAQKGRYEIRLSYTPHPNRASNVPVAVHHNEGVARIRVDQRKTPPINGLWISLGKFALSPGNGAQVEVENADTDGFVVVDAVQALPVEAE
ncbi:MAG TPA: FAD-dependent oxidoreductase [Verrucomicrobiales bacterium]|nr:FAD-dependent oxidoreductase [Verrucomicrobiales bacterium]